MRLMRQESRFSAVNRIFKRADVILAVVIVAATSAVWLATSLLNHKGEAKTIKVSSAKDDFEIPLSDTILEIPGVIGQTLIRVKDGQVWVEKASCPNKVCVRQGRISKPGETIVCLPNRVVVTIEGAKKTDAVTY